MQPTDLTPYLDKIWTVTPWGESCPECGVELLAMTFIYHEECSECEGDGCEDCDGEGYIEQEGIRDSDPAVCPSCHLVWWWSADEDGAYLRVGCGRAIDGQVAAIVAGVNHA